MFAMLYDTYSLNANTTTRAKLLHFFLKNKAKPAIVLLVRIFGPHPSDPGSSPGGGIFIEWVLDFDVFCVMWLVKHW